MKKQPNFLTYLLAVFLLYMSACTPFAHYVDLESNPVYGTELGLEKSRILYMDDFANVESGWQTRSNDAGSSISYLHQGLRFVVNEEFTDFWSIQNIIIADVQLAVDASRVSGPDDNVYGLICRYTEENNYYAFVISSDGYYAILKMLDGNLSILTGNHMDFHDAINQGRGTNRIRADCISDELSLFVNNTLLETVIDKDISEGRIGLVAGTKEEPGAIILFDNFILYQP